MDAVAHCPRFFLDSRKVFSTRRRFDAQHIFHHKQFGTEKINVAQKFLIQMPALVLDHARPAVGTVALANRGITLTRRPANDHIHRFGFNQPGKVARRKSGDVALQRVRNVREIFFEDGDGFGIEVNGRKTSKAGALHAEAEPATAAEQVEKCEMAVIAVHYLIPRSQKFVVLSLDMIAGGSLRLKRASVNPPSSLLKLNNFFMRTA
jgi:hypothetical protein